MQVVTATVFAKAKTKPLGTFPATFIQAMLLLKVGEESLVVEWDTDCNGRKAYFLISNGDDYRYTEKDLEGRNPVLFAVKTSDISHIIRV